jgi:hypothetical protein
VPIFFERFLLPVAAAIVVLVAITNPMGFDWQQRISGALAVVFIAYFVAHSLHLHNQAKTSKPEKDSGETVIRVRELLAEGNRIVQVCQTVPDPYHTPASNRADLANMIAEFENRAETVLSIDPDPRPQKMWRGAVLLSAPQNPIPIALYCTQLNVKMDILQRILNRKLTSRQQLKGQLERFIRDGVALRSSCLRGPGEAGQVFDTQINWMSKVMEWLGDNFDESYQDQFNTAAPGSREFGEYPDPVKGMCQRMQPRIEVLESIYKELGS